MEKECFGHLRIAVHAPEEVVYAEICHEDRQEGEGDVQMVVLRFLQPGKTLMMDAYGIDHEGDEGPCLFGYRCVQTLPRYPSSIRVRSRNLNR